MLPPRDRLGAADLLPGAGGEVGLNGWIKIAADGAVLLAMNRSEMGQGVHTALAMLVAEELDVPLARVRLIPAGADRLYGNVATMVTGLPYFHPRETEPGHESTPAKAGQWVVAKIARELGINVTGGSSSVVDGWDVLPLAAATARARLVGAASIAWKQPAGELVVREGVVSHASGATAHYGELARMAAATPTGAVQLKRREDWRLLGTAARRIDAVARGDGSARFGIDVRPPGLVFAAIRHCPMLGGGAGAVDVAPALALAGVERVVRLGPYAGSTAALAVVGRTWWHAQRGRRCAQGRVAPAPGRRPRLAPGDGPPRGESARRDDRRRRLRVSTAAARSTPAPTPAWRATSSRSIARRTSRTRRWSRSTALRGSPRARSRSGRRPRRRAWRARSPPRSPASPRMRSRCTSP